MGEAGDGGTVGVLVERVDPAGVLWNQCDGADGRHGGLRFCPGRPDADRLLLIGSPLPPGGLGRRGLRERARAVRTGRERARLERAWDALGVQPERVDVLFYEPTPIVSDAAYAVARERARRVFGPDDRATHPIDLPVWWSLSEGVGELRALRWREKSVGLVCVTSGKRMIPGHDARLGFLTRLRESGVGLDLYGRGLDASLGGRGEVGSKSEVLAPARVALAIENDAGDARYVTEKLWDALLCGCVVAYFGAGVPAWVPPDAVVRLPDLGPAGVEVVRGLVAEGPAGWEARAGAIAEARERVLGAHRLVEWYRREVWSPVAGHGVEHGLVEGGAC